MASDKAYDAHRRLDALAARVGGGDLTWTDTGSLTNGWSKVGGFFKYRMLLPNVVFVVARALNSSTATTTDGTVVCSAANGLQAGYRPATQKILPAYCDVLRLVGANSEAAALRFMTDGSVQCFGIAAGSAFVECSGLIALDI